MFTTLFKDRKNLKLLVISGAIGIVIVLIFCLGIFERLELLTMDYRFFIRGMRHTSTEVAIIGITQDDMNKLGSLPWPRSYYARVIDYLKESQAKVISFDVFFPRNSSDKYEDQMLIDATKRAGNVLYPVFTPAAKRGTSPVVHDLIYNMEELSRYARQAHINVTPDMDGIIRRVPVSINYRDEKFWALGISTAARFLNMNEESVIEQLNIPQDKEGNLFINYANIEEEIGYYPFSEVLNKRVEPYKFKDRIVLIGQLAHGLANADILPTPFKTKHGLLLHASIIDSILNKSFLRRIPSWVNGIIIIPISLLLGFILTRTRFWEGMFLITAFMTSYIAVSIFLFNFYGLILDIIPIIGISILSVIAYNIFSYSSAKEMSDKDSLTGLYNHRYSIEALGCEIERFNRIGHPVSVAMLDIDYFKRYNDTYGHRTGDMVLKELSGLLKKNTRKLDIVGRYGGEEFILILPATSKDQAGILAERIRNAVQTYPFCQGRLNSVTISVGIATCPEDSNIPEVLIEKSDNALYEAKEKGRNRVCIYQTPSREQLSLRVG